MFFQHKAALEKSSSYRWELTSFVVGAPSIKTSDGIHPGYRHNYRLDAQNASHLADKCPLSLHLFTLKWISKSLNQVT